jgi:predicted RNase H-like HicB family nuclease
LAQKARCPVSLAAGRCDGPLTTWALDHRSGNVSATGAASLPLRSYTARAMQLKSVIEAGKDSGFVAHVPALKGCWSQVATREQAIENVREAIQAWLEVEQDKTERLGAPTDVELVNV